MLQEAAELKVDVSVPDDVKKALKEAEGMRVKWEGDRKVKEQSAACKAEEEEVLRNSCPSTTYPTFSSLPTTHPISPSTNSSLHQTGILTHLHSFPTPRSPRRNPVPIIDASPCFTFLVLICFALPPVLRSTGLHSVPRMLSSLDSTAAPHSLRSTRPPFRFPFLHRTIPYLFLSLVQRCGSLP